jgi:cytochrome P450
MDEPEHMKYRLLTQAWFMPASIKKREEAVRALAKLSVDEFVALPGQCDFVTDVAMHYPLRVVMQILGVPMEDYPRMLRLTQELFGAQDPDVQRFQEALSDEQYAQLLLAVIGDFTTYFEAISADRRANPRDDLATLIANAQIDGAPMGQFEATGYYTIVATAGWRVFRPWEVFLAGTRSIAGARTVQAVPGADHWDLRVVSRVVF